MVARVEKLRWDQKLPPRLIVGELAPVIVHRWLRRLGLSRLGKLQVTGNSHRQLRRSSPNAQINSCTST